MKKKILGADKVDGLNEMQNFGAAGWNLFQ
jgi:hypothetical protein